LVPKDISPKDRAFDDEAELGGDAADVSDIQPIPLRIACARGQSRSQACQTQAFGR
jgi:hypothetical protein